MTDFPWARLPVAIAIVASAMLGGCASKLTADVTSFHDLPAPAGETVQVVAKDPEKQDTLEFQRYADLVGEALGQQGYRPPVAGEPTDLVAAIDYGVGQGRQSLRDDDGGSSVGVGVGGGSRGGVSVGVSTAFVISGGDGDTIFVRRLYLEITRRSDGARLFEGRAISDGRTRDLGKVMPYLVEALFRDFPGTSGETHEVKLDVSEDGPEKY